MDTDQSVRDIIELCDPRTELNSESEFIRFWIRARSVIGLFIQKHIHTTHTPIPPSPPVTILI
jgi:hypothetical protein